MATIIGKVLEERTGKSRVFKGTVAFDTTETSGTFVLPGAGLIKRVRQALLFKKGPATETEVVNFNLGAANSDGTHSITSNTFTIVRTAGTTSGLECSFVITV